MSAVCFSSSSNQGLTHLTVETFLICGKADYTGSWHSKSRRENKDFGPYQNARFSERFQGQKLTFWPAFFFKHKLHLILPMTMQKKSQRNVNFKGIKFALKTQADFRHRQLLEPFSEVNINLWTYTYKKNIKILQFCVKKDKVKGEIILILKCQNALGKQKIQFLLQSSSNVNINTVWKLKNF